MDYVQGLDPSKLSLALTVRALFLFSDASHSLVTGPFLYYLPIRRPAL